MSARRRSSLRWPNKVISPRRKAKLALANPAEVKHDKSAGSINYAADYVMDALNNTIGAIDEDIVVTTTIDLKMQAEAERALTDELNAKGAEFGVEQGALVALDPSGAVKAMVGGRNYADSQFNRAVAAKRQPGSSFKPFVYLAALEKGLTPDTVRDDAPITVKGWSPENYSREYFGPGDAHQGASALSEHRRRAARSGSGAEGGSRGRAPAGYQFRSRLLSPSIALGSSDVTPLEMVSAYAAFANGGFGVQPHVIARVRTANGKQLYARRNANFGRVIEPQYVAMMNQMMQETLLTGTARKAELPGWQAAGKTGTSQDWRDAWFLATRAIWSPESGSAMITSSPTKKVSGGNLPVEIWSRFMRAAHEGVPVAALPLATWRGAEAQSPDASPTPPLNLTGSQIGTGGRGGRPPPPAPPPDSFVPQARVRRSPRSLRRRWRRVVAACRDPEWRPQSAGARQRAARQTVRNAVRRDAVIASTGRGRQSQSRAG